MSKGLGGIVAAGITGAVVWAFSRARADQAAGQGGQVIPIAQPAPAPRTSSRDRNHAILGAVFDIAGAYLSGDKASAQGRAETFAGEFLGVSLPATTGGADSRLSRLLSVIGSAEAPRGYNQVYGGIRAEDRPPRPLTTMTVAEVLAWQDSIDRKYPSEAAGRYQIMEDTLRGLVRNGAVSPRARFDAATQDRLAIALMREKGLDRFLAGRMSAHQFADRLARIWAGLPVTSDQRGHKRPVRAGQSYYAGDGLNAATVSPQTVLNALRGVA